MHLDAMTCRLAPEPVPTTLWLDAVLGGGIVPGGVYMVVGVPGVGKTTMLMQAMSGFVSEKRRGLYISGDQTTETLGAVGARLGLDRAAAMNADVIHTWDADTAISAIQQQHPALVVVDSVQSFLHGKSTLNDCDEFVRRCIAATKESGAAIAFVLQMSRGGLPMAEGLAHRADCRIDLVSVRHGNIDFDGRNDPGPDHSYVRVRAVKNRFGSVNVERVLQITKEGLFEV